jgi:hypothetical protein
MTGHSIRFSLRTMFVVLTVFCIWLGWESSVVRQRQAVLKELKGNPAFQFTSAHEWAKRFPAGSAVPSIAKVPLLRGWLGDEAIQEIWFMRHLQGFSELELQRLTRVFPEAQLQESHPEPCHPGCFPRGTLVETPQGPRRVEDVQPGDSLTAILRSGESVHVQVQSVFVTSNRLWKVETEAGDLITTETQPLCLALDRTLPAGKLQSTDSMVLGDSEFFVAGGFLARSKPPAELAAR